MDFKEIKMFGLIKDFHVRLEIYLDISLLMDVVVIDVMDAWGMLLSRKWVANLGGSIQMDLSYATIPTCKKTYVIFHYEQKKKYHVEHPRIL